MHDSFQMHWKVNTGLTGYNQTIPIQLRTVNHFLLGYLKSFPNVQKLLSFKNVAITHMCGYMAIITHTMTDEYSIPYHLHTNIHSVLL